VTVRETWLTPFGESWIQAYGGTPPWGEMAKVFKPHSDELGPAETLDRWRLYLAQTDGRYASPTRFARTIGIWTLEAIARARPEDIRSMTVGQFNARTLQRVLARIETPERTLPSGGKP
jgi:hypothetical protein